MKQNSIKSLSKLSKQNYENIFNVYLDDNNFYYYNLLQTIVFPQNLPLQLFDSYKTVPQDTWPVVSYKAYNTTKLWWIILLANNIQNPLDKIEVGTILKIPTFSVVDSVLSQINTNK